MYKLIIKSKENEFYSPVHDKCNNRMCNPIYLKVGECGLIETIDNSCLRTSVIQGIDVIDNNTIIETMNTIYTIKNYDYNKEK